MSTPAPVATFANGVTIDLVALTADSENARYEVFLSGFAHGFDARQAEVDRLNYEADRLYTEMSRRAPVPMIDPNRPTYAELERRRGNHEHAEQVEAANAARFAGVTS
jgi:hypothetical protein